MNNGCRSRVLPYESRLSGFPCKTDRLFHRESATLCPVFDEFLSIHAASQLIDFTIVFHAFHRLHGDIDPLAQSFRRTENTGGTSSIFPCLGEHGKTFQLMSN